jgi:hypothetical protein
MRRPISSLCLAALALCASAGAALAAAGGAMTVDLHESRRVALAGPAASVVVDDPTVADVAMADAHSVLVIGRGYGATRITVTDGRGHTLLASLVTVVSPDHGRVTLTRGGVSTDYGCAGNRCHPLAPVAMSSGGAGGDSNGGGGGGGVVAFPVSSRAASTGEAGAAAAASEVP